MKKHSRIILLIMMLSLLGGLSYNSPQAQADSQAIKLEIYHLSDYHSHAVPSYAEGDSSRGGIARTIGLLKAAQKQYPNNLLIFSGGDTINLNNPIWSDAYNCTEWSWFNNILDGMALGNHEFDYGANSFNECAQRITYPIISSGLVKDEDGQPYLPEYAIYQRAGLKIGVIAVAGDDFPNIVKTQTLPAHTHWRTGSEKLKRVAQLVEKLRKQDQVDIVISIGHQYLAEDYQMAQTIPGIDLILGTHGHLKAPLTKIPQTNTYFISPYQYLDYLSHVTLAVKEGQLVTATGELIPINKDVPEDSLLAAKVATMYAGLKSKYPERFEIIGEAATLIDNEGLFTGESMIGDFAADIARQAVQAHAFFNTSSSFRAAIPPGPISRETYLTALPYNNQIVTVQMTGKQLLEVLTLSARNLGSDSFSQISGIRYELDSRTKTVAKVQILRNPLQPEAGYQPLDLQAIYLVAGSSYLALVAGGYKDIFAAGQALTKTDYEINKLVTDYIHSHSPVSIKLDGRVKIVAP